MMTKAILLPAITVSLSCILSSTSCKFHHYSADSNWYTAYSGLLIKSNQKLRVHYYWDRNTGQASILLQDLERPEFSLQIKELKRYFLSDKDWKEPFNSAVQFALRNANAPSPKKPAFNTTPIALSGGQLKYISMPNGATADILVGGIRFGRNLWMFGANIEKGKGTQATKWIKLLAGLKYSRTFLASNSKSVKLNPDLEIDLPADWDRVGTTLDSDNLTCSPPLSNLIFEVSGKVAHLSAPSFKGLSDYVNETKQFRPGPMVHQSQHPAELVIGGREILCEEAKQFGPLEGSVALPNADEVECIVRYGTEGVKVRVYNPYGLSWKKGIADVLARIRLNLKSTGKVRDSITRGNTPSG